MWKEAGKWKKDSGGENQDLVASRLTGSVKNWFVSGSVRRQFFSEGFRKRIFLGSFRNSEGFFGSVEETEVFSCLAGPTSCLILISFHTGFGTKWKNFLVNYILAKSFAIINFFWWATCLVTYILPKAFAVVNFFG